LAWASARPSPAQATGTGFFCAWRFGSAKISLARRHPSSIDAGSQPPGPHPPNRQRDSYLAHNTDEELARELFESFDAPKKGGAPTKSYNPPELYTGSVAIKLAALLDAYDQQVVTDAVQVRTYITNRLLEISQCGDSKQELRAIELLGKLSDVGAFTEKSEITVTHKTSDDLRKAIQSKIQRLLDMEVIDVEAKSVEEELGLIEDEYSGTTDTIDQDTQTS
jgi:hypothetical protein